MKNILYKTLLVATCIGSVCFFTASIRNSIQAHNTLKSDSNISANIVDNNSDNVINNDTANNSDSYLDNAIENNINNDSDSNMDNITNDSSENNTNNDASKPISEYTEADYIKAMCDALNNKYHQSFQAEDIKIVNVSKADSDTIFEAVCQSKEYNQEFKVYINQTKLTVTDDYERFLYETDILDFIANTLNEHASIPITEQTIIYAMNSKAHTDLNDYLLDSDSYISLSIDCADGLDADTITQLISACQSFIDNNYKFKLKCNIGDSKKTYFHDPAHKQPLDTTVLNELKKDQE